MTAPIHTHLKWFDLAPPGGIPGGVAAGPYYTGSSCMTWDQANGNLVLFGGTGSLISSQGQNDTWLFDGSIWTKATPQHVPPPRQDATMAYLPNLGVVMFGGFYSGTAVVFGGSVAFIAYNDTWVWTGHDWYQPRLQTSSAPSGRWATRMAYHPPSGGLILYGGHSYTGVSADAKETWLFTLSSGPQWVKLTPAHNPDERQYYSLTLDSAGLLRLAGGVNLASTEWHDTWTWNGTDWTQISGTIFWNVGGDGFGYHANYGKAVVIDSFDLIGGGQATYIESTASGGWTKVGTSTDPRLFVPQDAPLTGSGGAGLGQSMTADMSGNLTYVEGSTTWQLRVVPAVHVDMHYATQGYPSAGGP